MGAVELIEVIIGLVFVILLLSIAVSLVNEIIVTNLKIRSKTLKKFIGRLLDDPDSNEVLSKNFYNHPLIKKLTKKEKSNPSYISASTFSKVLIDILRESGETKKSLIEALNSLPENSDTKRALLTLLNDADSKTQEFKANIEEWFDESMTRLSGWYKRYTQIQLFVIGFILAVVLNVNVIHIAKELSDNKEKRLQIADAAYSLVKNNNEELSLKNQSLSELYRTSKDALTFKRNNPEDSTESMNTEELDSVSIVLHNQDSILYYQKNEMEAFEGNIDKINKTTTEYSGLVGIFWQDLVELDHPEEETSFFHRFIEHFHISWLLGWIIAGLGASLGSSFWFDILKKLINIRGTVKPEEKK